ncbi:LPXTG-motif cell wall-anchored protein [Aeromicrobium panaciterrae]|uniref:LPXTG-motif cell wall-anchored protein n=1 Tax=Aeromicrobium panaciterrae TaxID=363861 RepID=A0ABU1ULA9_9ACTN|nr:LPXTG cell wall anchor domain-containing protein [Aeromicrobium panaciterrae]MDR7085940.1 LPXTG-motif cell wall-anchored protein [Aeromicrobium panaciterrae]
MMKIRLIAAAVIAGAATLLSAGSANAGYSDPPITLTLDDNILVGGNTFSYTADSGSVECDWTITYNDGRAPGEPAVQQGSGTSFSGSYKTKVVTKKFKSPITATCEYDDGQTASTDDATTAPAFYSTGSGASTLQAAIQEASASATVTLLPLGGDDSGSLPDTGGSNLSLILLGGGLVLVGGGVTYMARRRQSSH